MRLRYLLTGGDALTRRPRPDLGFTVVNNYGLSETTVVATSGAVAPGGDGAPSIGRPIAGVVADVVDERLQPVEPGGDGELVLGGVAIARGYLNRPELTAERFIDGPRGRRYRTGDRVRVRADGEIEFLGRLDDQLSIRGFRVEPGEIAAALNSHPAIEASVAVGVGRSSSERRLVAYLVARTASGPTATNWRGFLGDSLPDYMVPSGFVWLDQLPLTEHGKIDRDALPAPSSTRPGGGPAESRPVTRVEAGTAFVVAELLDIEEIGLNENFFLLGGHSMLGAQLIVRLEDMFRRGDQPAVPVRPPHAGGDRRRGGASDGADQIDGLVTHDQRPDARDRRPAAQPLSPPRPGGAGQSVPAVSPAARGGPRALGSRTCTRGSSLGTRTWSLCCTVPGRPDARRRSDCEALGMGELSPIAALMVRQMLFLDPPEHTRVRGLASAAFTPRRVARAARAHPADRRRTGRRHWPRRGRFDVMDDLADPLPAIVTAEMLGVPDRAITS